MTNELTTKTTTTAPAPAGCFGSLEKLAQFTKIAEQLSKSELIPATFRGKPADVLIALDYADRLGMNPLSVLQNIYIVSGRPAWSSTFYIATISTCGRFSGIDYVEKTGPVIDKLGVPNLTCKMVATDNRTGKRVEGAEISIQMACDEGWYARNGSKWRTMPRQMLRYRSAAFFARAFCPEVTMGLYSADEVEDFAKPTPSTPVEVESISDNDPRTAMADDLPDQSVIWQLHTAKTLDQLETIAGQLKGKLLDEVTREAARKEYAKRKDELQKKGSKR